MRRHRYSDVCMCLGRLSLKMCFGQQVWRPRYSDVCMCLARLTLKMGFGQQVMHEYS